MPLLPNRLRFSNPLASMQALRPPPPFWLPLSHLGLKYRQYVVMGRTERAGRISRGSAGMPEVSVEITGMSSTHCFGRVVRECHVTIRRGRVFFFLVLGGSFPNLFLFLLFLGVLGVLRLLTGAFEKSLLDRVPGNRLEL